jgi:hypothetical protein
MFPVPEPSGDIHAQLRAVLDARHPKVACFVVPKNLPDLPHLPAGLRVVTRKEGTLVTTRANFAGLFEAHADDDEVMARILGYPEDKALVVSRCRGLPAVNARAVQARDRDGHVVTEAFASPLGFLAAVEAMGEHVPAGGSLAVLSPVLAISRRVALRWVGF